MHLLLITLTLLATLVHSKDDQGRIINGQDVPEGKYPFMASLQSSDSPCDFTNGRGSHHFCGGSVINDNTILTAAHCVDAIDNVDKVSVLVGLNHLDHSASCYKVDMKRTHPEWTGDVTRSPDIGILKLKQPIDFKNQTKKVRPICLPRPENEVLGDHCILMGWGINHDNTAPRHLQELTVKAMKTGQWNDRKKDMHYSIVFRESGGQSCFGDSGGPMVCPTKGDEGTLLQFGVCSFGYDSDLGKCRGVAAYTNTARYIDWLKKEAEN